VLCLQFACSLVLHALCILFANKFSSALKSVQLFISSFLVFRADVVLQQRLRKFGHQAEVPDLEAVRG